MSKKNSSINNPADWRAGWQHSRGLLFTVAFALLAFLLLTACQPSLGAASDQGMGSPAEAGVDLTAAATAVPQVTLTPYPTRPPYSPGEWVAYTAQTGDTLPALATRFNTSVEEILAANDFIPADATTMPPGMPMQIPIYYEPFWGSPYQILPDSLFVNGPAQVGFDTAAFLAQHPGGWLNDWKSFVAGRNRNAAEMIDYVAAQFSISPRLLLALLEYQLGALSQPQLPAGVDEDYPLGYVQRSHRGLYLQLVWAANQLNNGYYGWRTGQLTTLELPDGTLEPPDPWQNAATVALQYYFSQNLTVPEYHFAAGSEGLARTYAALFGDPWVQTEPHIPGSLRQPEMLLPFESGKSWAFTGGPHTGWGAGLPFAAIDFAPPANIGGCTPSREWNTAVAAGVVARVDEGILELDLDGDGDPRTGWVVFYLHLATEAKAALGATLEAGQPLGHPSCEGGTSTGTHVHIARKFNGEWISAEGPLAFNLEGWIARNGTRPYEGTLTRFSQTVVACDCSNKESQLTAGER